MYVYVMAAEPASTSYFFNPSDQQRVHTQQYKNCWKVGDNEANVLALEGCVSRPGEIDGNRMRALEST
jgi:hypothetical protein